MIWKLTEMMGRYQTHTGEKLSYETLVAATGLSTATIASLSKGRALRLDLGTLEKLLTFFSARLGEPLSTNDLLEWRGEAEERKSERTEERGSALTP